jgi:CubicO group peptidase (beta-lactamase class C family)
VADEIVASGRRARFASTRGGEVCSETPYQAASISKTVAAITALALAAGAHVALDTDVATYLTRWHLPPPPTLTPKPVTLRRLFGMTAGAVVMTNGNDGGPVVDAVRDALARHYQWPARAPWPE